MGAGELAVIHANPSQPHQVEWAHALRDGFLKHGLRPCVTDDRNRKGDINVINGPWWAYAQFQREPNTLMIDRAFWGDPQFVSIGWLQPDGSREFMNQSSPADRWDKYGPPLEEWTDVGLPVVFGDYGSDRDNLRYVLQRTRALFRPHPAEDAWRDCPAQQLRGPLKEVLEVCGAAIGWKSTALIAAVIAGVPTICLDPNNPVWPVAGHRLDKDAPMPDRTQWAWDLAYAQWTLTEARSGEIWENLKP